MPRKVRFKKRYSHGDSRNREPFAVGRSYTDFQKYIEAHPYVNICEMDTVIGTIGGKVLLTLLLRSCSLLIAFLLPDKSADSVIQALNDLSDALGIELFRETFGVILTDRGTEFSNPYGKYFSWYALPVWIKSPNPIIIIRFGKNEGYLMIGRIEEKTAVIAVKCGRISVCGCFREAQDRKDFSLIIRGGYAGNGALCRAQWDRRD